MNLTNMNIFFCFIGLYMKTRRWTGRTSTKAEVPHLWPVRLMQHLPSWHSYLERRLAIRKVLQQKTFRRQSTVPCTLRIDERSYKVDCSGILECTCTFTRVFKTSSLFNQLGGNDPECISDKINSLHCIKVCYYK